MSAEGENTTSVIPKFPKSFHMKQLLNIVGVDVFPKLSKLRLKNEGQ